MGHYTIHRLLKVTLLSDTTLHTWYSVQVRLLSWFLPSAFLEPPSSAFHCTDWTAMETVYIFAWNLSITAKAGPQLGDILCSGNNKHPSKMDLKTVHKLMCLSCLNGSYIGETQVNFQNCMKQHQMELPTAISTRHICRLSLSMLLSAKVEYKWDPPEILITFQDRCKSKL